MWQLESLVASVFEMDNAEGQELIHMYGFRTGYRGWAVLFLLSYQLLFRVVQVVAYVKLWKPQK